MCVLSCLKGTHWSHVWIMSASCFFGAIWTLFSRFSFGVVVLDAMWMYPFFTCYKWSLGLLGWQCAARYADGVGATIRDLRGKFGEKTRKRVAKDLKNGVKAFFVFILSQISIFFARIRSEKMFFRWLQSRGWSSLKILSVLVLLLRFGNLALQVGLEELVWRNLISNS